MSDLSQVPVPSPAEDARLALLYHFCRLQVPAVNVSEAAFRNHLSRAFAIYAPKADGEITWATYLDGLYAPDWTVCVGCLERLDSAWELLFAVRTGRSDCLLVDALRARACRLYPRDEERHEGTISRQTDKLRDKALAAIGERLVEQGWTGDDLERFIVTEMGGLLVDDPRLSADQLGRILAARGKQLPAGV